MYLVPPTKLVSPLYEVLKSAKYQNPLILVGKAVRQNTLIHHLKRNGTLTDLAVEDKAAVHIVSTILLLMS